MTPHPVDLEALQKLLDGVPRPWVADNGDSRIWAVGVEGTGANVALLAGSDFDFDADERHAALIVAAVNALPALLAEVRAGREARDAWYEVRWEIVKMTAGNPDAVKWFRPHIAIIDAALASPSVPPPQDPRWEEYDIKPHLAPKAAQEAGEETAALKEGGG